MEIGRRPYKTQCRFLRDNGTVSEIRWIEARPDAQTISGWSGIVSLDMCNDAWVDWPLGEVRGAPRTFTGTRAPVGFDGTHQCATASELEFGGAYLPDLPPAPYDAQGFLDCCKVPDVPPPPNYSCGAAYPLPIGEDVPFTAPGGTQLWWLWNKPDSLPVYIRLTTPGLAIAGGASTGTVCPPPTPVATIFFNGCANWSIVTPGKYWVSWFNSSPDPSTGTFKVDYGACS